LRSRSGEATTEQATAVSAAAGPAGALADGLTVVPDAPPAVVPEAPLPVVPDAPPPVVPDAPPAVVPVVVQERSTWASELPLPLVIAGVAVGLVVIAMHHFRWGNLVIASSLLGAAFLRLVLPTRQAGLLVVRSRLTDVATMSAIGGSLMLLALVTRT
jgi:Protein of unknown function (DUF3017)